MPVLPAVASTTRPPGLRSPRFSASRIIHLPARSLTDWPGFMNSALPRIVQPVSSDACLSLIRGVLPIAWMTSLLNFMLIKYRFVSSLQASLEVRDGAHKPSAWRGCYLDLANTTCRTSILPERNPASQYDK